MNRPIRTAVTRNINNTKNNLTKTITNYLATLNRTETKNLPTKQTTTPRPTAKSTLITTTKDLNINRTHKFLS
jgi:hypothetical protein